MAEGPSDDRYAPGEPRIRRDEEWDTEIDEVAERDVVGKEGGFEHEEPPDDTNRPEDRRRGGGDEREEPRPDLRESD